MTPPATAPTSAPSRLHLANARLYQTLRTAHLERAHELTPASILYRVRRYDFDERLVAGLEVVQASRLGAARLLLRSGVTRLEVNEPLMLPSLPATALAIAALRLRRAFGGQRATIVTYAIGNADPFAATVGSSLRRRARRALDRRVARAVWKRIDRVVFGTDAARETYEAVVGPAQRGTTILALPSPFPGAGQAPVEPESVVFLGALAERKGLRILLAAWPQVAARRPGARLVVLGKGPLQSEVEAAAAGDSTIRFEIDPPRERIHEVLDRTEVLTLPSQPSATWREQVGLPIVEGLSHGCRIVTTSQTALAPWLDEQGHQVSRSDTSADALAEALLRALEGGPGRAEVLASLPERDGRLSADDWLFGDSLPGQA